MGIRILGRGLGLSLLLRFWVAELCSVQGWWSATAEVLGVWLDVTMPAGAG